MGKYDQGKFEELLTAYLAGNLPEEGEKELLEGLQENAEYRRLYAERVKAKAVSAIPGIEEEKKKNYRRLVNTLKKEEWRTRRATLGKRIGRVAVAALLVITTSISGYYLYRNLGTIESPYHASEVVTPYGSQSRVTLPDGTQVWLNSGSILAYDDSFGRKDRRVSLSGEGYFEVRPDAEKPFKVKADALEIEVTGTVFNLRSYEEDATVEVNLIQGSVLVSSGTSGNPLALRPDQKAVLVKETGMLMALASDARKAAVWKEGRLSFVNTAFDAICQDLERRYDVRIEVQSGRLRQERFSGNVDLNMTVEEILDYFDVDNRYRWSREGNLIRIVER